MIPVIHSFYMSTKDFYTANISKFLMQGQTDFRSLQCSANPKLYATEERPPTKTVKTKARKKGEV